MTKLRLMNVASLSAILHLNDPKRRRRVMLEARPQLGPRLTFSKSGRRSGLRLRVDESSLRWRCNFTSPFQLVHLVFQTLWFPLHFKPSLFEELCPFCVTPRCCVKLKLALRINVFYSPHIGHLGQPSHSTERTEMDGCRFAWRL